MILIYIVYRRTTRSPELVLWCVVAFTKERSAWSSRTKMLNQSDWIISNCTSSLLLRELLLVPIGCSTLARLAAVHPSSAQPPPSPSLGPRSSATRSRKGLVWQIFTVFRKYLIMLITSPKFRESCSFQRMRPKFVQILLNSTNLKV